MPITLATRTDVTLQAERLIRDPSQFKWYAVTLLVLVFLVYGNEIERGRLDIVAAGLALWLADWFNEIVNAHEAHRIRKLRTRALDGSQRLGR
jgi:hypothetical protein